MSSTFRFLTLIGFAFLLAACEKQEATGDNPETDGVGDGTVGDDFIVGAESADATYSILATKNGDGVTPCVPTESDKDIICIIDMEELDVFARGVKIDAELPASSCKYLGFIPYYYNVAPVSSVEPINVWYSLDIDGEFVAGAKPTWWPGAAEQDVYYRFGNGDVYTHDDIYGNPAEGADDVRCPWNYSDVPSVANGKDCCTGDYSETVTQEEDDGNGGTTAETTTEFKTWGTANDNCFRGPGKRDYDVRVGRGYIVREISNVPEEGLSYPFEVSAPITHDVPQETIHVTNFYTGTEPVALQDGQGTYEYQCLDNAEEVLYRIRVKIREWNEHTEFEKFKNGETGDPDTGGNFLVGTETYETTPFGTFLVNDRFDWDDYVEYFADDPSNGRTITDFSIDETVGLDLLGGSYTNATKWLGFTE